MRIRLMVVAALVAAGTTGHLGCRRGDAGGVVSDSTFVTVMSQLRYVESANLPDSAARAQARERVLQSHGVTAEELENTARELTRLPGHAANVWRAIDQRLQQRVDEPQPDTL